MTNNVTPKKALVWAIIWAVHALITIWFIYDSAVLNPSPIFAFIFVLMLGYDLHKVRYLISLRRYLKWQQTQ